MDQSPPEQQPAAPLAILERTAARSPRPRPPAPARSPGKERFLTSEKAAEMDQPLRQPTESPLKGVRTNIVQSIRAFRVHDLQEAASALGQHFLYANLANAQTKQDVLDMIAAQFTFPAHFGKNFDALYDCMTDPLHKSGPQPGFIVVVEQIPATAPAAAPAAAPHPLPAVGRDGADPG